METNLINHLTNILQAFNYSLTPPATQFHNKPISGLTYEEYISQELSIFRKIVTEPIIKMDKHILNTLRCIMSTGLDYGVAKRILTDISGGNKILYNVLNQIRESSQTIIFEPNVNLQCIISNLCCHKKQIDSKLNETIKLLKDEWEKIRNANPVDPLLGTKQNEINLFESYKKVNYDPLEINAGIVNYTLEEIPNNGLSLEGDEKIPLCSFWRCIQDFLECKGFRKDRNDENSRVTINDIKEDIRDMEPRIMQTVPEAVTRAAAARAPDP